MNHSGNYYTNEKVKPPTKTRFNTVKPQKIYYPEDLVTDPIIDATDPGSEPDPEELFNEAEN